MSKRRYTTRSKMGIVAAASLLAMTVAPVASVFAATAPTQARIGGADRMATAIQIANKEYPNGPSSGTVVLASGANANLIDSVTAAPLAAALGAPILLSQSATNLSTETSDYLTTHAITKVYLIGAAANATLKAQLPSSVTAVTELSGTNRWETAAKIAQELQTAEGGAAFSQVIVASGVDQAMSDVLAAAPYAAANHIPILLADPTQTSLPSSEAGFVTNSSSQTEDVVGTATGYGLTSQDSVKTIGSGTDNFANAVAIDKAFAPTGGYKVIDVANDSSTDVVNANGMVSYHLVDAITGGPLAAMDGAGIVFTNGNTVPTAVSDFLASQTNATQVNIFGQTQSISDTTASTVTSDTGNTSATTSPTGMPQLGNITVTGQSFGTGSGTSPAVTVNGSPLTVSAALTDANGNPVTGVDLTLKIAIGSNQSTPTVEDATSQTILTPTSSTSVIDGVAGDTYQVPLNNQGVANAQISLPSGVGSTYTIQYQAPYTYNNVNVTDNKAYIEFVSSNTMGIAPVGSSGAPYNAAESSLTNETTGLVPVTVTLPPLNGSQPSNVTVTFQIMNNLAGSANAGAFMANAQGSQISQSGPVTVNTDSNGEAVAYVNSNSTTGAVEVQASASDSSGSFTQDTYVQWGQANVGQKVKSSTLTASNVTNDLGNAPTGQMTGVSSSDTSVPLYTANIDNNVSISGQVTDANNNPVPNYPVMVVASSTQQANGTNSYVDSSGTKTAFPAVGTCTVNTSPSVMWTCDTAISGNPIASSSYGEQLTTDASGYFHYTVVQSKATGSSDAATTINGTAVNAEQINQYEVYGVQNGEISQALTGATVQVAWGNGQNLTMIGVAPTNNVSYHDGHFSGAQITAASSPPTALASPTLWFQGIAGSVAYGDKVTGPGESATYNVQVNNTGTVGSVFFVGADGNQYQYVINPLNSNNANTEGTNNGIDEVNTGDAGNGAGAVTISVNPIGVTGTTTEYSISVNGTQVAGPNAITPASPVAASSVAYATSSSIGLGIQDSNTNSDTVTISSGSVNNTATVDVLGGSGYKMHADSPASLNLTPGSFGKVTLNVVDVNSNPVANAVVPVAVYDYANAGLTNLWVTAINGVTLQQNENIASAGNSSFAQEPTPIPLYNVTTNTPAYSVVIPGVVSWSPPTGSNNSTMNVTTDSQGQVTLTLQAGDVPYWTSGSQLNSSPIATSGNQVIVAFLKAADNTSTANPGTVNPGSFEVQLVKSSLVTGALNHGIEGTITY